MSGRAQVMSSVKMRAIIRLWNARFQEEGFVLTVKDVRSKGCSAMTGLRDSTMDL